MAFTLSQKEPVCYNARMNPKKIIEVGCAIIIKEGMLLIAQRHHHDYLGGYWEFPGGKQEPGETPEECLIREIQEELGVVIRPEQFYRRELHSYPEKTVALNFYFCRWVSGAPQKIDCQDFCWVGPEDLAQYQFPPADKDILEDLLKNKGKYFGLR